MLKKQKTVKGLKGIVLLIIGSLLVSLVISLPLHENEYFFKSTVDGDYLFKVDVENINLAEGEIPFSIVKLESDKENFFRGMTYSFSALVFFLLFLVYLERKETELKLLARSRSRKRLSFKSLKERRR